MREESDGTDLEHELTHVLEECRMVLPGIQALFGFQLIAFLNDAFWRLSDAARLQHVCAAGLSVLAIMLVLTPAAYHRQAEPDRISRRLVNLTTGFLTAGMVALMLALCVDFHLVAQMTISNEYIASALTAAFFFGFIALWFILPQVMKRVRQA